jgi:hypothetical protein
MIQAQRSFLHDIVLSHVNCAGGGFRLPPGQSVISAATTQMGGGCVIEFQAPQQRRQSQVEVDDNDDGDGDGGPSRKVRRTSATGSQACGKLSPAAATTGGIYLNAEVVLKAMCRAVFASAEHKDSWRRHSVCSILLQRISSGIHMPRDALQRVGDELARIELEVKVLVHRLVHHHWK